MLQQQRPAHMSRLSHLSRSYDPHAKGLRLRLDTVGESHVEVERSLKIVRSRKKRSSRGDEGAREAGDGYATSALAGAFLYQAGGTA